MKRSESSQNNSVRNAIVVLEYLASIDNPQDISVISKTLGMNKSTTYRLLSTLAEGQYVYQDEKSRQYSLGSKISWLSAKYLEKNEVRKVARPLLESLSQQVCETIHLGVMEGQEIVYIDKINGQEPVIMASHVGQRVSMHCTALGKCILAYQPENKWQEYVDQSGLPEKTPHTITTSQQFFTELEKVRAVGISNDDMENEEGIRCVASPIFNASGHVVAAVSISSWILTMTQEHIQILIPLLQKTTSSISSQLGYKSRSFHKENP